MTVEATFDDVFGQCRRFALHLEMRDDYGTSSPGFVAWRDGVPFDRADFDASWVTLVSGAVARGWPYDVPGSCRNR